MVEHCIEAAEARVRLSDWVIANNKYAILGQ